MPQSAGFGNRPRPIGGSPEVQNQQLPNYIIRPEMALCYSHLRSEKFHKPSRLACVCIVGLNLSLLEDSCLAHANSIESDPFQGQNYQW